MGKRNNGIVVVIQNLTKTEAARVKDETVRSKQKYAPNGKGRVLVGKTGNVAGILQKQSRWLNGG